MRELYHLISKYKEQKDCVIISGITGEVAGEKLLLADGQPVFETSHAEVLQGCLTDSQCLVTAKIVETAKGQVFVEHLMNNARMIVCGAGTVGQEVIKLGKQLGLTVIVLEDRQEYADLARKLGADEVLCMAFEAAFDHLDQRSSDYYVVLTREHQFDKLCLENILGRQGAYVGMMASKTRAAVLKNDLIREGYDEILVESVHSPIGLGIHAETPAEIAVSILAEMIQTKNSKVTAQGYQKELLKELVQPANEPVILATIVKRTGSAPRDVGTKMLIYEDGHIVGSVGGGWIEAGVLDLAKRMFENGQQNSIYETDQTSKEAILCGGYETIYLEMIS